MGTKYTSQTQSGYNANPPPDDGSTGANNLISWANNINKIGNPLLNLAQGINSALVTALDFSSRTTSTNDTASAADHMKTIEITATGATTMTLPTAATEGSGYIVGYKNVGTGIATIVLQTNTNTLDGIVNGTFTLQPGQGVVYKTNTGATGYYTFSFFSGGAQSITSRRQSVLIGPVDVNGLPSYLPQTATGLDLTTQNITALETVQTSNVTTPVASPGVVTWTGHTLVANQAITFTTNGALPTGLVAGTVYYVLSPVTNTFNVSATPGGAAINFTGSTSGQSVAWAGTQFPLTVTSYQGNDSIYGEINVTGMSTSNLKWTGLTNNSTNYLYVTISNGILTTGFTTLAPVIVDGNITSPSSTSGQITINLTSCEVYLGNGSTAVETPLVIVGTATTSGGNITATNPYNYGKSPSFSGKMSNSLLKVTTFTAAGTYTFIKSALCNMTRVIVANGTGGGGGGSTGNGASGFAGGSGGTGGGCTISLFDSGVVPNAVTVTVGAAGTAGTGGVNGAGSAGGNGGVSSFGSLVSGGSSSSYPLNDIVSPTITGGTCPGANLPGGHGFPGGRAIYAGWGGDGGAGGGGVGGMGGAFGSGGAGGGSNGTTTGTGANGAAGIGGYVIVEEYC